MTTETGAGTPQGAPISPLLCNVALHVLDAEWTRTSSKLGVLVRFADDFVVLCRSRAAAEEALRRVTAILGQLGLQLHPDKTRIVCLTRGEQGFDFLGFHHHKVESWRWRGRYYLHRWPSDRAMRQVRAKVREATSRRDVGRAVEWVVADLNHVLRGWGAYFRYGNSARKFAQLAGEQGLLRQGVVIAADKGLAGRQFEGWVAGLGAVLVRPDRRDEPHRYGSLGGIRQWIESIIDTRKDQLGLEHHGAHTPQGLWVRVAQRLLALAAGIWFNWQLGIADKRSLVAYDSQ